MEMQGLGQGASEAGQVVGASGCSQWGSTAAPLFCFREAQPLEVPRFQKSEGEEACKGKKVGAEKTGRPLWCGGDGWLTLVMLRR